MEHDWLTRLAGTWDYETECIMGPDKPPTQSHGVETVRTLGRLWIVAESEVEMPGGGTGATMLTLGYDPALGRFTGSFVGSMMANLWLYDGSLDAERRVLTLDSEGPNFEQSGTAKYQDIIEIVDENHRIFRSQVLGDDGNWVRFMTSQYRRRQ
jgi:hypothetical protein